MTEEEDQEAQKAQGHCELVKRELQMAQDMLSLQGVIDEFTRNEESKHLLYSMMPYEGSNDILKPSGSVNDDALQEKRVIVKSSKIVLDSKECMMLIFVD